MIAAGLLIGAQTLTASQVFFTDFESGAPAAFSGAGGVEATQGFSGIAGFQSMFLRNSTLSPIFSTTLTLTSLPSHTALSVGFLVAIIDQWDGAAPGFDDRFNVSVDGTPVFSQNYTNFDGSQPYGGTRMSFGCLCGFNPMSDSSYAVMLAIPHTASTATIDFVASGPTWAADDNSWAIDNVSVSAVPEPGAGLLAMTGLGALIVWRRRR
jgi:MYXO-CTERM domain-containing protein